MKWQDELALKIAFLLPKKVAYWATIRVGSHAIRESRKGQTVYNLLMITALRRWDQ